jgi:serine/threonine-protein kinase
MTPEQWSRVKAVFEQAIGRSIEERAGYVALACGDDPVLRGEVEALLAGHNRAAATRPLVPDLQTTRTSSGGAIGAAVHRVGAYEILHEIGHGGMGTVYLATRDDDTFRKRVALKIVKRGMDTDEIVRRFRYERQILAGLDHPNIARLLDGGTTPDGLPYFAMEYVEGQPITEFCDTQRLDTRQRLILFQTVCRAVQHAHQNLVVHRDLKPANILVTADGTPKLLDFGFAKVLNPELNNLTIDPTSPLMRLMTPEYASPEQIRGQSVTTVSDVYALGVLLYELVTGHKPYRVKDRSLTEIARAVCEDEPEKPSTAISRVEVHEPGTSDDAVTPVSVSRTRDGDVDRLRKRLKGDVDNIVLKAMRKEAARRYASAEQLAEDIARHLDGRPVRAQRDTVSYRLGKFVTRHRAGVAASAAFVLLLAAAVVALAAQSARIRTERDTARQVSSFLVNLFKYADPAQSRGGSITAREILDRGVERLRRDLTEQPEIRGRLLNTMGSVYVQLNLPAQGGPVLQEAVETLRARLGDTDPEVLDARTNLGRWQRVTSKYDAATETHRDVLQIRRRRGVRDAGLATTLDELGMVLAAQQLARGGPDGFQEPERFFRESVAVWQGLPGGDAGAGAAMASLANMRLNRGDPKDAQAWLTEALATMQRAHGNDHPALADVLWQMGTLQATEQRFDDARASLAGARATYDKIFPNGSAKVGGLMLNQGWVEFSAGDVAQAQAHLESGAAMLQKYGPPGHAAAIAQYALIPVYWVRGRFDDAEAAYKQGLSTAQALFGPKADSGSHVLIARFNLSLVRQDHGDPKGALALIEEVGQKFQALAPPGHVERWWPDLVKASAQIDMGQYNGAETPLREAFDKWRAFYPAADWRLALAKAEYARCLIKLGRDEEGHRLFGEAVPILRTTFGGSHPRVKRLEAAFAR